MTFDPDAASVIPTPGSPITAGTFARFYLPLVATSYLLTATNPLLAAALARTSDPATALSGYGVAFSLIGVIYAPLLVIQQVAAQRLLSVGDIGPVRRFTAVVAFLLSGVAALVAFTPIGVFVMTAAVCAVWGAATFRHRREMTQSMRPPRS